MQNSFVIVVVVVVFFLLKRLENLLDVRSTNDQIRQPNHQVAHYLEPKWFSH